MTAIVAALKLFCHYDYGISFKFSFACLQFTEFTLLEDKIDVVYLED